MKVTITRSNGELSVLSPYSDTFKEGLKIAIPARSRAWSKPYWVISEKYESELIDLIIACYGVNPEIKDSLPERVSKEVRIEYLGRCKKNENGESLASGYSNGRWSFLVTEEALKSFFEGPKVDLSSGDDDPTYYAILTVPSQSDDREIKSSYRRLARQWHPDVNQGDPDAEEMFKKISEAYEVLSNPLKRRKYNFMLQKMKDLEFDQPKRDINYYVGASDKWGYRSPLKCGIIQAEGIMRMGRMIIDKISGWQDIVDGQGNIMVVSWPRNAETFSVHWV